MKKVRLLCCCAALHVIIFSLGCTTTSTWVNDPCSPCQAIPEPCQPVPEPCQPEIGCADVSCNQGCANTNSDWTIAVPIFESRLLGRWSGQGMLFEGGTTCLDNCCSPFPCIGVPGTGKNQNDHEFLVRSPREFLDPNPNRTPY
ncbi:MAG: hypothetical protein ACRC10_06355 [Thermoguttaceae bacterium]